LGMRTINSSTSLPIGGLPTARRARDPSNLRATSLRYHPKTVSGIQVYALTWHGRRGALSPRPSGAAHRHDRRRSSSDRAAPGRSPRCHWLPAVSPSRTRCTARRCELSYVSSRGSLWNPPYCGPSAGRRPWRNDDRSWNTSGADYSAVMGWRRSCAPRPRPPLLRWRRAN
jgi:hypothetical protein